MVADDDGSRPRGILSPADRSYLEDPEKYAENHSRQAVDKRIEDIRERTRNAILDFKLLFESDGFDEPEREKVFAGVGPDFFGGENADDFASAFMREGRSPLEEGIVHALALFYQETEPHGRFKNLLSRAVNKVHVLELGEKYTPGFTVARTEFEVHSVSRVDVESIKARVRSGEELSDDERIFIMSHLQEGAPEELEELIDQTAGLDEE